jgi:hypothetical protein
VVHQCQEIRQVGFRRALEQGQHPVAVAGVDEVVGVLDAVLDALVADQVADRIAAQEFLQRGARDLGVDRHREDGLETGPA